MMKLRNFLYLNTKVIDDYISAIDGFTYQEESQTIASINENAVSGRIGVPLIGGSGEYAGKSEEEITRAVYISDASRFDRIYKYLEADNEDGLRYYECLNSDIFNELKRDDFLEVLVTARFSRMKELTDSVKKFSELAKVIESFSDQGLLDEKTREAIDGFAALGTVKSSKGIACVFEFENGLFPLIAYLDQDFFQCDQDSFVGQGYLLCKIIRKVSKGQKMRLDELFEDIKKIPINREQKRKMKRNIENPVEIRDEIKGPALVVLPIAVYR